MKDAEKKIDILTLSQKISSKGFSVSEIASLTNIDPAILERKLAGLDEFRASEIYSLADALGLSNEDRKAIFFSVNNS